jgi:thiamine biosynthesis lipoprotein
VEHRHEPPPGGAVQRLAGRNFYRALDLDAFRGHPAVRFGDPDLQLDLGGIAKGYAVDRVVERLEKEGVPAALVSAGGSTT